ncbi:hypothetical protein CNMCM5878_003605 [Aspergillus fumigatiaffinis]|nr:hypothetical protein CNMCM5878_003605 [Aspergillus fumigatiaffinis]
MKCGYPRFFVHPVIQELAREVVKLHGNAETEAASLFPSPKTASVCRSFILSRIPSQESPRIRIVNFVPAPHTESRPQTIRSPLSCVIYPTEYASMAKQVWQHSGNGISSRRGEFCLSALRDGFLVEDKEPAQVEQSPQKFSKGPRRYQGRGSANGIVRGGSIPASAPDWSTENTETQDSREYVQFIEERFGRNLSVLLADQAKRAVRRRIAGVLTANVDLSEALDEASGEGRVAGLTDSDVFLFPSDTLKTLEKWGPGCLFYGHGSSEDLDDLESRLQGGERFLALFTEFPGNPLLKSPDLKRIYALSQKYDFALVVDETVGNFLNINVLPYADIVVSSLTKVFSGDSNVMGGSAVINPHGRYYQELRTTFSREYEDNLWAEDAVFLERNSRDFVSRIEKINNTTEDITALLKESPVVKDVYYPKYNTSRVFYEDFRTPNGGYGGLFSITFHSDAEAIAFFDHLEVLKGPSLGTNFTLSSPYTLLAHYNELDWAASFGVESNLVRISVGLEDVSNLRDQVQRALAAAAEAKD